MPPSRRSKAKAPNSRRAPPGANKRARSQRSALDDELDSGDSDDDEAAQHAAMLAGEPDDDEIEESVEERRVRLAKEMISAMDAAETRRREAGAGSSGVARGAERDAVAEELEEDALRRAGQYRCYIASKLEGAQFDQSATRVLRGPRLSPTCVAVAPDESFVACGCKAGASFSKLAVNHIEFDDVCPKGIRRKRSGLRSHMRMAADNNI